MEMIETHRIGHNDNGETPPPVEVVLSFASLKTTGVLTKVKEVMLIIAKARIKDWPSDQWFKMHLPKWFLSSFEGKTLDAIESDPLQWDFGSWLDAMKSPGWEWWSSEAKSSSCTIKVSAFTEPFSISPLEYLVRTAGGKSIRVEER